MKACLQHFAFCFAFAVRLLFRMLSILLFADIRNYLALRRLNAVMREPRDLVGHWVMASELKHIISRNGHLKRWRKQRDRAAWIVSDVKRRSGNMVLLWLMYPEKYR